eukprot:2792334-Pleurochrysis_carterae.AAC.8
MGAQILAQRENAGNLIRNEGCKTLAEALQSNTMLTSMLFSGVRPCNRLLFGVGGAVAEKRQKLFILIVVRMLVCNDVSVDKALATKDARHQRFDSGIYERAFLRFTTRNEFSTRLYQEEAGGKYCASPREHLDAACRASSPRRCSKTTLKHVCLVLAVLGTRCYERLATDHSLICHAISGAEVLEDMKAIVVGYL